MNDTAIKTPQTHPDHHTVGHRFKSWDGHEYYCDSYDPRQGYWMTRADAPEENKTDEHTQWRRNVSERAIGRTYHIIYSDGTCALEAAPR